MAVAQPVDVRVNPNDPAQFYVLWGNGRIDAHGGAVPIMDNPKWYDRVDMPVAVALHITDWATGAGYVLDFQGGFIPFGGAPSLMVDHDGNPDTGNRVPGVPYAGTAPLRRYCDWSWNPNGSGQGYVITYWGELFAFGGAPAWAPTEPLLSSPAVRAFVMDWSDSPTLRGISLDMQGGLHEYFSVSIDRTNAPWFPGWDVARDLAITQWEPDASGYVLTGDGATHRFGVALPPLWGGPFQRGGDVARELDILSASDPLELRQVWSGGQIFPYVASTPPTVTAGGSLVVSPAAIVTGTTRPVFTWDYSDPQQDSQDAWELFVFTEAFAAGHIMTDPAVWAADAVVAASGIQPGQRGLVSPVDLPNGSYREYVRARDTAGQWSAWDVHSWTQNVPAPVAPTALTALFDDASFSVDLSVTATAGGSADLIRFEYSEDAGVTWLPVRDGGAVELAATTAAADRDIPMGATRQYRARSYATDPAIVSDPSNTATATNPHRVYALTVVGDPALGGEVRAKEPVDWERPVEAGIFQGVGADFATVLVDGKPKGRRTTMHLTTVNRAAYEVIKAAVEKSSTFVYRDPFGELMYCRLVEAWRWSQMVAAPLAGDVTPLRHMHSHGLPLVEVRPPHLAV